jgi:hypothetical protein
MQTLEPKVYTLQLTLEQLDDILHDLSLAGFLTTFSLLLDALPEEALIELQQCWSPAQPQDEEEIDLGYCCACERTGPTVRHVLMLPRRGPVPGAGWGCFKCGLPADGAVAVVCDDCLEHGREVRFACAGYAAEDGRIPVEQLPIEPFEHDMSKHEGE